MICHAVLGIVVGSYLLAPVTCADLTLPVGRNLLGLLALLYVIQFGTEHFQCLVFVLELRSLFLTFNYYPRRFVSKPYGRLGFVDMLTARAA